MPNRIHRDGASVVAGDAEVALLGTGARREAEDRLAAAGAVAAWFGIPPGLLAGLPDDVIAVMAARLEGDRQRWHDLARRLRSD